MDVSGMPEILKWAGWGVALFLLVWKFFVPRRECDLIHEKSDGKLARAEADIAAEKAARHALANALAPVATGMAVLTAEVKGMRDASAQTHELVKSLVDRG